MENEDLSEPMTFGVEPYLSKEWAEQEADRLWAKVWQHACRLEEIPHVGDFVTYEILNDSIISSARRPIRSAPTTTCACIAGVA